MTLNRTLIGVVAGGLTLAMAGTAAAESTLRVVMHSDLKIVDPIWTTAYISRNYGYMVYDTLFALDEQLAVQPQMVESYEISDDNLTYTFTLLRGYMTNPRPAAFAASSSGTNLSEKRRKARASPSDTSHVERPTPA